MVWVQLASASATLITNHHRLIVVERLVECISTSLYSTFGSSVVAVRSGCARRVPRRRVVCTKKAAVGKQA